MRKSWLAQWKGRAETSVMRREQSQCRLDEESVLTNIFILGKISWLSPFIQKYFENEEINSSWGRISYSLVKQKMSE